MSKIRDGIEHYRLQSQVDGYGEFRPEIEVLKGAEEVFYYKKDENESGGSQSGQPYRLVRDSFDVDGERYQRVRESYTDDFVLIVKTVEYNYGKSLKTIIYTLDASDNVVDTTTTVSDISYTWDDMSPSQGWPEPDNGLGDIESDISTLQTAVSVNALNISTNSSSISSNNSDITTINSNLSTIDDRLDETPEVYDCSGGGVTLVPSRTSTMILQNYNQDLSLSIGNMRDGQIINIFSEPHTYTVNWSSIQGTLIVENLDWPTFTSVAPVGLVHIRVQYIASMSYMTLKSVGLYIIP